MIEADMKKLQDTAALFEVSFPDYKQLRQCRSDIILVKAVWDMVIFVKVYNKLLLSLEFWRFFLKICELFNGRSNAYLLFLCVCVRVAGEYRRLDQDSVEGDQRRANGHGAQTIRQSTTRFHQLSLSLGL